MRRHGEDETPARRSRAGDTRHGFGSPPGMELTGVGEEEGDKPMQHHQQLQEDSPIPHLQTASTEESETPTPPLIRTHPSLLDVEATPITPAQSVSSQPQEQTSSRATQSLGSGTFSPMREKQPPRAQDQPAAARIENTPPRPKRSLDTTMPTPTSRTIQQPAPQDQLDASIRERTPARGKRSLGRGTYASPSPGRYPSPSSFRPPPTQQMMLTPAQVARQPRSSLGSTPISAQRRHLPAIGTTPASIGSYDPVQMGTPGSTGSYRPFGRFSDVSFSLDASPLRTPGNRGYDSSASDSDTASVKEPFSDQVDSLNILLTTPVQALGYLGQTSLSPEIEDDYLDEEERELESSRRQLQRELSAVDYSIFEETPENTPDNSPDNSPENPEDVPMDEDAPYFKQPSAITFLPTKRVMFAETPEKQDVALLPMHTFPQTEDVALSPMKVASVTSSSSATIWPQKEDTTLSARKTVPLASSSSATTTLQSGKPKQKIAPIPDARSSAVIISHRENAASLPSAMGTLAGVPSSSSVTATPRRDNAVISPVGTMAVLSSSSAVVMSQKENVAMSPMRTIPLASSSSDATASQSKDFTLSLPIALPSSATGTSQRDNIAISPMQSIPATSSSATAATPHRGNSPLSAIATTRVSSPLRSATSRRDKAKPETLKPVQVTAAAPAAVVSQTDSEKKSSTTPHSAATTKPIPTIHLSSSGAEMLSGEKRTYVGTDITAEESAAILPDTPKEETSLAASMKAIFGFQRKQPGIQTQSKLDDALASGNPRAVAAHAYDDDSVASSLGGGSASGESIFQSLATFSEKYGDSLPSPDRASLDREANIRRPSLGSPHSKRSSVSSDGSHVSAKVMSTIRLLEQQLDTPTTPPDLRRKRAPLNPGEKSRDRKESLDSPAFPSPLFPDDEGDSPEGQRFLPTRFAKSDEAAGSFSKPKKAFDQPQSPFGVHTQQNMETTPDIKDARERDGTWLLRTMGTFDSGPGHMPSPIVYADDEEDEIVVTFDPMDSPTRNLMYDETPDLEATIYSFDDSKAPPAYPLETHTTVPPKSYSSDARPESEYRSRYLCFIMAISAMAAIFLGLVIGLTDDFRDDDPNNGTGPGEGSSDGPSMVSSVSPSGSPTISFVPSVSLYPSNVPTLTTEPTRTFEPFASPSSAPTGSPTGKPANSLSFETFYDIVVENGLIDSVPSEEYEPDLIESMNLLTFEVLENIQEIEEKEGIRRRLTLVLLPTSISNFTEIECAVPNDRDRCETVTAEITLVDADNAKAFKFVLDIAIAIGRLQYYLDEVNPQSPVAILDSSGQPTMRESIAPSHAPTRAGTNAPSSFNETYSSAPTSNQTYSPAPTATHSFGPTGSAAPSITPTLRASTPPSSGPSGMSVSPTTFDLFEFLIDNSFDGGQALHNASSAQHHAYMWLSGNSGIEDYSEEQLLQRYTMATFYYSTNGDEWFSSYGWLTDEDECNWYNKAGTKNACTPGGELKSLELDYNNLNGILPNEIGLLSNSLERMVLRGGPTSFTHGQIPSELGYLTMMEAFFIRGNEYSGSIPTELGKWLSIAQLDLSNNRLSGPVPPEVGNFGELLLLDISINALTGELPSEIGNMRKTTKLIVENNMLTGAIPSELGWLRRVQNFMGGMNMFTSMPSELGRLQFCDSFSLHNNDIRGTLPVSLGTMRRLRLLELGNNAFTGSIPSELGALSEMRDRMDLSYNHLSGAMPSELGKLDRLRILELHHNKLSGEIPSEFSSLRRLTTIRLDSNDVGGETPTKVCKTFNTTYPAFHSDCLEFADNCPCCTTCCVDEVGCECRYLGTPQEFLCYQQKS